jgi:hypothetical protein
MQITRTTDGYTITATVRGALESETYIGYTKSEAVSLFCRKYGI